MAHGDCPDDDALRLAWEAFCDRLRAAGANAFKDYNPANGPQRADAFRFLTQNLGQAKKRQKTLTPRAQGVKVRAKI